MNKVRHNISQAGGVYVCVCVCVCVCACVCRCSVCGVCAFSMCCIDIGMHVRRRVACV